jgi:hypothetical protein
MFGFGKRKKIEEQFFTSVQAVLGTYSIMRALSSHRMKETGLDSFPLKVFEAAYIFGVVDAIAHGVDLDEKYLSSLDIAQMSMVASSGLKFFEEDEVPTIFKTCIDLNSEGNAIHELMYLGAKDAQVAISAMLNGEDSSVASKAMSLEFLDNKELISKFSLLF